MVLECRSPPTETNRQLKGPRGRVGGEWEGFQEKKLSLSNELKLVQKLPLFPHSLCLISNPAHSSRSSDFFFFVMLTPSKRRGNQHRRRRRRRGCHSSRGRLVGQPFRLRMGRRLVATWSWAMCWHVLHPLPSRYSLWHTARARARKFQVEKRAVCKATTLACHQILKGTIFGKWWQLKSWRPCGRRYPF